MSARWALMERVDVPGVDDPTTQTRRHGCFSGDRVQRGLRPHAVAAQVTATARLAALKARADGFGPDDWRVMEALHNWALHMPHPLRLRWLAELGGRTDDLWLDLDSTPPTASDPTRQRPQES